MIFLPVNMPKNRLAAMPLFLLLASVVRAQPAPHPIVLHAARLLEIETGHMISPGEVLVQGERIVEAGSKVSRPLGAEFIELGDRTLLDRKSVV
jgi:hypothetical protein